MIDENKLIEKRTYYPYPAYDYEAGWNDCNRDWMVRIWEQPQVGGWIPVSERLPKEYETVIGVTDLNYYCIAVYCKQYGFRSMDVGVESDIIAWQPLPEPFKEEADV